MSTSDVTLRERLNTYSTTLVAGVVAVLGLLLMALTTGMTWFDSHESFSSFANQLGGLLVVTGGLTVLWDLRGKRDLIQEVLAKVNISSDVQAAGITRLTMNWMDLPWSELFRSSRQIDVFISYGTSWRNNNWNELQEFASKRRNRLRVFLPDPHDDATMRMLALRYDYPVGRIKANVLEMAEELAKLSVNNRADIRVYYRAGDPTYTVYRFDETIIVTLYSNKRARGPVPVIMVGEGSFRDFVLADIEKIHEQSDEVALDALAEGARQ